jgi:hypothetical protein
MAVEGAGVAVRDRKQPEDADIESNLIDIRRYLQTHARSPAPPEDSDAGEPSAWETYRHAEYSDGHRPRFSRTDLILIILVLALGGLLAVFVFY